MTWFDHLFVLALVIGFPAYAAWDVPRFSQRVEADPVNARIHEYAWTVSTLWGLTFVLGGWWLYAGRPFGDLGLIPPQGASRWWTIVTSSAAVAFFASQAHSVARSPEAQATLRAQVDPQHAIRVLMPATAREMRMFAAVAVTAGVCEEILYRGYLLYYLRLWLPGFAAVLGAIVVFGVAHLYQGARGILLTGIAGAAAMGLYLLTGSLIAPMALHATIDLANGYMAYRAYKNP